MSAVTCLTPPLNSQPYFASQKSKDRAPSPFYPTGKLLTDASDPAPLVTTQIRTRRTAALAAAASAPQESASAGTAVRVSLCNKE